MTLEEKNKLVELFDSLLTTTSFKQKSDIVFQAKHYIFNQMNDDEIRAFFVNNPSNFENLSDKESMNMEIEVESDKFTDSE